MQTLWKITTGFFKWTWRVLNLVRNLLLNIFFFSFVLFFIATWMPITGSIQNRHVRRGALLLDISGTIVDKPSANNQLRMINRYLFPTASSDRFQENSLFSIVEAIRQAKEDYNITGIVLDLKNFSGATLPSMQYIGKALQEFRDSGKPVIAIGDNYSQDQYYLASFANKIWLSPFGVVDLHGFSINNLYYKSLLDKLKVSTHVFRVGTYKSAIEPFIRNNMSLPAREVNNRWINELWNHYLTTVAVNRRITPQELFPGAQTILNRLQKFGGDTGKYALNSKLVDALGSSTDIEKMLIEQFGWNRKDKNFNAISFYNYSQKKPRKSGDKIAVIFVNGVIMDGKETLGNIGGDTTAAKIREVRLDPKVKAIILRVNSPGGSISASEVIRSALVAVRMAAKPIVVSMGGIAASGGYWISTPANYIIANQSTLTGSIGVFGVINTIENSLDYLGIHSDGVATSPLADVSITKSLPLEVSKMMQLSVENGYERFLRLVAKSRQSTPEQINKIAQGYVWTGQDAKRNGLVDSLGDFDDAIAKAVELAKLKEWHVDYYQYEQTFFDVLLNSALNSVHALPPSNIQTWLFRLFSETLKLVKIEKDKLVTLNDPKNCYVFCQACDVSYRTAFYPFLQGRAFKNKAF